MSVRTVLKYRVGTDTVYSFAINKENILTIQCSVNTYIALGRHALASMEDVGLLQEASIVLREESLVLHIKEASIVLHLGLQEENIVLCIEE